MNGFSIKSRLKQSLKSCTLYNVDFAILEKIPASIKCFYIVL